MTSQGFLGQYISCFFIQVVIWLWRSQDASAIQEMEGRGQDTKNGWRLKNLQCLGNWTLWTWGSWGFKPQHAPNITFQGTCFVVIFRFYLNNLTWYPGSQLRLLCYSLVCCCIVFLCVSCIRFCAGVGERRQFLWLLHILDWKTKPHMNGRIMQTVPFDLHTMVCLRSPSVFGISRWCMAMIWDYLKYPKLNHHRFIYKIPYIQYT